MRALLAAFVVLLAFPAAGLAEQNTSIDKKPSDGCLVVKSGQGTVTVSARGGIFGRVESGRVTVEDLTPNDGKSVKVFGAGFPPQPLGPNKTRYSSDSPMRFRATGTGAFRVTVNGIGIDLSAIGYGWAILNFGGFAPAGTYSVDPNSFCSANFQPVPRALTKVTLGTSG
jgi:hypothetical protein